MNIAVQGAVNALGFQENGIYYREPDCFETIRDIIRYLRLDTPELTARIECGRHNIINEDLVPLLKSDDLPEEIFDVTIRLLVNLCQPTIATLQGKAPEDSEQYKLYWQLEENLRRAKCAFADADFFRVLRKKLDDYFEKTSYEDRGEDTRLVMERIVLLLRYILSINPDLREKNRTALESNSHDRVVSAFIESGIDKSLIHIIHQPNEKEFHVSIMDIFALVLKEHIPENLINISEDQTNEEKQKLDKELKEMIRNNTAKEIQKRLSFKRFGGSYVVKGMKSLANSSEQVVFKPVENVNEVNFGDNRKTKKRVAKNRRPFEIEKGHHISSVDVRLKIKEMLVNLVKSCFNRLIKSCKKLVFEKKNSLQRSSHINYFFLVRFVLRFVRLSKLSTEYISQCSGVDAFHENNIQLAEYVENACTLKGIEAKSFGIKAQYALEAYNELVLMHHYIYANGNEEEKQDAKRCLDHILKVEEYRELPIDLIKKIKPGVFSNTFVSQLVLTTHNYIKLLEKFHKSGDLKKVSKKKKIKKSRKHGKNSNEDTKCDNMKTEELDKIWETISEKIERVLRGEDEKINDIAPFDAKLDVDEAKQQKFAMLSIQRLLRGDSVPSAVGLYHAARQVWLTSGIFGTTEMIVSEELNELKEIFFFDLKNVAKDLKEAEIEMEKKLNGEDLENEDEEEEEVPCWEVEEIEFNISSYVEKYANVDVLKWYIGLLKNFARNSDELNKALVKMLHRIGVDLKMVSKLYQLSLFHIFWRVDEYFMTLPKEEHKKDRLYELYHFGFYVLKKFFAKYAEIGENLAVEVLFWKSCREIYEIENGYGTYEQSKQADQRVWTEDLEKEVRDLHEEYRMLGDNRDGGIDVIDFIEHSLSRSRTRRQIYRKLKELGLDLMGSRKTKGNEGIESELPVLQIDKIYEDWQKMESKDEVDVVELIREQLADAYGPISRKKLIKHLAFTNKVYEKPRKKKELPKWEEGLIDELKLLKEQYEEISDAENLLGIDIVRYVMKRLSVKKPVSQVERYLISFGCNIEPTKKAPRKMNLNDFVDNKEEEKTVEKKATEKENEREERKEEKELEKQKEKDGPVENEEKKEERTKVSLLDRIKNRKRSFAQLSYSDSEDSEDEEDDEESVFKKQFMSDMFTSGSVAQIEEPEDESHEELVPISIAKKRKIVISDDEDD